MKLFEVKGLGKKADTICGIYDGKNTNVKYWHKQHKASRPRYDFTRDSNDQPISLQCHRISHGGGTERGTLGHAVCT